MLSAAQSRMNGQLALETGSGIEAALFSFGSGLVLLFVLLALRPSTRAGLGRIIAAVRLRELRWWQVLGGLLGAYFVAVQSFAVPAVGVALFLVAVVAGQSGNSLVVDRIGLGPAGKQAITGVRVLSSVLAVLAVGVAVSGRFGSGSTSLIALVLAISAGAGIAIQAAINGRVARQAGDPMSATLVNFVVGTVGLLGAFFVINVVGDGETGALLGAPWWAYFGGAVGVVFIGIAVWVVPVVGVLVFAVTNIAGQMVGALALDAFAPTPGNALGWNIVVGSILALVAAVVVTRGRAPR